MFFFFAEEEINATAVRYSASSLKSELSEIYDAITKTTVIYEVCMINI